jgi:hypothetical protein
MIKHTFLGWVGRQAEIRDLTTLMENNDWHKSSVWSHTLSVVESGERLLSLEFIASPQVRERFGKILDSVVDPASALCFTRAELLYSAMFLHDIGKAMNDEKGRPIMQDKEDGTTNALGHAKAGAAKGAEIAARELGLSPAESAFVQEVIAKHMEGFNLASAIEAEVKKGKAREAVEADQVAGFLKRINCNPAVVLHTMADLSGSEGNPLSSIQFHAGLLESMLAIKRARVLLLEEAQTLSVIEDLLKRHDMILVPGSESREALYARLEAAIRAELLAKVESGKIPADKVEGIIIKRLSGLKSKIEFRPGEITADMVEDNFDFINGLSRKPVILVLN